MTDGSAGYVTLKGSNAGVRSVNGKVTVRNLKTSESWVLTGGQGVALQRGLQTPPLAQVASNAPTPIPPAPAPAPAPAPQAPAGRTSGGLAMDTGAWLAVIGGGAVTAVAIWGVVTALNNKDKIDDLQAQVNLLNAKLASPSRP
jgi:hypothetical protein